MKLIPYGIDDFDRLIRDDYYYIDKTRYIKTIEGQNSYILFVRPRRMGKSLFTNMLMSYYDIAKKDEFDQLFGNLWIGKNPTKWANKFVVLKFDFSLVDTDPMRLIENFSSYCMQRINNFFDRYSILFTHEERESVLSSQSAKDALVNLIERCRLKGLHTYLFIDEYDNFSNVVLTSRGVKAHELITHGERFYRNFFKAFKGSFERIFMTGVTPVTYDDLTSGFNIADVVALLPQFDKTIGVTEIELRDMIDYYRAEGKINRDTDSEWRTLQECLRDAAVDGNWQKLCDMIGALYSQYSSLRNGIRGEYDVQGFLRGLLCLNHYYDIWPELELGSGYCDVLLIPKITEQNCPTKHSYVIEIKYMKASETNVQAYIDIACSQLGRYVADKHLTASNILQGTTLTKIYLIFRGQKLIKAGKHE